MSSSVRKPKQPKDKKSEGSSIPEKVISSLKRSLKIYKDAGLKANKIVGKTIRMASEVASPLGITNKQLRSEINKLMKNYDTMDTSMEEGNKRLSTGAPEVYGQKYSKDKKASGGMVGASDMSAKKMASSSDKKKKMPQYYMGGGMIKKNKMYAYGGRVAKYKG